MELAPNHYLGFKPADVDLDQEVYLPLCGQYPLELEGIKAFMREQLEQGYQAITIEGNGISNIPQWAKQVLNSIEETGKQFFI